MTFFGSGIKTRTPANRFLNEMAFKPLWFGVLVGRTEESNSNVFPWKHCLENVAVYLISN
jgi:hypothetical protein